MFIMSLDYSKIIINNVYYELRFHVDIFIVLDTLADQLDITKRFGDHTVTFISEYKKQVTKKRFGDHTVTFISEYKKQVTLVTCR